MYVCGPTVYDSSHIGHAMSYLVFDVVRRYLEYRGYKTKLAQNFTDVDDKIINRANDTGEVWTDIIERYIREFKEDMESLNVIPADAYPRASEEIPAIIEMIEGLMAKGYAYESQGDVYFRVERDEDYGKLNRRKLDEQIEGERVSDAERDRKEHPLDFALWKAAKPDEPAWASPWGQGRPGWHIECSAMSLKYLGAQIDIHGGGVDLMFPHHENEIAQTESYTDKIPFTKYWMHHGHLKVPKKDRVPIIEDNDLSALADDPEQMTKMSKSEKNFFAIRGFLEEHSPDALRLFVLNAHYRRSVAYTEESFAAAERSMERFRTALLPANEGATKENEELDVLAEGVAEKFHDAMDDDLNTALALGELFKFASAINRARDEGYGGATFTKAQESLRKFLTVLGFRLDAYEKTKTVSADPFRDLLADLLAKSAELGVTDVPTAEGDEADAYINALVQFRTVVRKAKQYQLADEVRKSLTGLGVVLEDTPQGTKWKWE